MARCRAGDPRAQRELYEQNIRFVLGSARRLGLPPSELEDKALRDGGARTEDERLLAHLFTVPAPELPGPLSHARVWQRLTTPERPRWPLAWAATAVAALALGAGLASLLRRGGDAALRQPLPQLVAARGSVVIAPAHAGGSDDTVRLDPDADALVRLPGVAALLLDEGAEASFGKAVDLRAGRLIARVTKRPKGSPFRVRTAGYVVTVVGTVFTVDESARGTVVSVSEGVVEVARRGDPDSAAVRVRAGERWSSALPTIGADDTAPDVVHLLALGLAGDAAQAAEVLGERALHPESVLPPLEASPLVPPPVVLAQVVEPKTVARGTAVREGEGVRAVPELSSSRGAERRATSFVKEVPPPADRRDDAAEAPKGTAPAPEQIAWLEVPKATNPPAPSPSPAVAPETDAYALGLSLKAQGDYRAAAEALERAAAGTLHPDSALFALGKLTEGELHDDGRARRAFGSYRARFPHGLLLPEVDFELFRLELVAGHADGASSEADHFVEVHPDNARSAEVSALAAELLRSRGDFAGALRHYRRLAAPLTDDTAFGLADCLRHLRDPRAAGGLRAYLDRFPNGKHASEARDALRDLGG